MDCYACDQPATRNCPRCARPYCPEHGAEYCAGCLDPLSAAPSSAVFRASLFGLLIASVLALWLLVRPPSVPGDGGPIVRPQPTPQVTPAGTKQPGASTARPTATPSPGGEPAATATPGVSPAEGTPAPTESGPIEYSVQEGDTWYGIAEAYGVSAEDLAAVNGLTLDDFLQPGQIIVIPR